MSVETMDYYEILEISKTADKAEIKRAYRKMAKKYHPDKNGGDKEAEKMFKLCNEAYQVLSDDNKRAIYDRYGKEGLEGSMGGSGGGFSGFDDLSSIFEEMFGGFGGGGRRRRNPADSDKYPLDMGIELDITFHEAVFGVEKEIKYTYKTSCKKCNGTGAKDGKLQTCSTCNGEGQVYLRQGFMTFSQTCPDCQGSGVQASSKCSACKGLGYEEVEESISVNIPKGVDTGNRLRVAGAGNISKKGTRGDLYITFNVEEDKHFIRNGNDIYIEVPVFFTQAVMGDTLTIPSLTGELELKLDVGTRDKQQFVFRNEGIEDVHGHGKGDLIVQIKLTYPKKLTSQQRELLQQLQDSFGVEEAKPHESFLESAIDKVKNWFK
jgi:molecular chaperone DnaJ